MKIESLRKRFGPPKRDAKKVFDLWRNEREVDKFLDTSIFAGATIGDYLVNGQLIDAMPPEVMGAFEQLMGTKADSIAEVRQIILSKLEKGPDSYRGLMNYVQGRVGEIAFHDQMKGAVDFALDPAQEGFDFVANTGEVKRYFQVKIYQDADAVLKTIEATRQKSLAGEILHDDAVVSKIEFAVNSDIYQEVLEKTQARGLDVPVHKINLSREDVGNLLNDATAVANEPFQAFLSDIIGESALVVMAHAAVGVFKAKLRDQCLMSVFAEASLSSISSLSGLAAAKAMELTLASNPIVLGVAAYSMRRLVKGYLSRRDLYQVIELGSGRCQSLRERLRDLSTT